MILIYGLIAAISGAITLYFLIDKKEKKIDQTKFFDYGGVRKTDFIKDRVMFYPYNYVNG